MPRDLYQKILGKDFELLPAKIREMHSFARVARGHATIFRGHSLPAKLICRLANLPQAKDNVVVETTFAPIEGGERWTRKFNGQPFQTDMIAGTGEPYPCMLERLGPFLFKMRVSARANGVDLTPEKVLLGPLRIPGFLAPKPVGREREKEGIYAFSVEVAFPIIGKVFGYEGTLEPSEFVVDHEPA